MPLKGRTSFKNSAMPRLRPAVINTTSATNLALTKNEWKKYFSYGYDSYGLTGHEWAGEIVELGKKSRDLILEIE